MQGTVLETVWKDKPPLSAELNFSSAGFLEGGCTGHLPDPSGAKNDSTVMSSFPPFFRNYVQGFEVGA